jgi:hypothetical protein
MGGTYMDMLFNAAALYAATLIIYGMLAIHETKFSHRKRSLTSMYGTPIPEKTEIPTNAFGRARVFAKHFFLRPSFITGVVMGVLVIRNYANPFTSCSKSWLYGHIYVLQALYSLTILCPVPHSPRFWSLRGDPLRGPPL